MNHPKRPAAVQQDQAASVGTLPNQRPANQGPGALPRVAVTDVRATSVGTLMDGVLQELGIADRVRDASALLAWEEVAGPRLAERARAIRVHRGKLELAVPSGVWRTHLSFSKRQLLQRLNAQLGRTVVRDLVFVNAQQKRATQ